MKSKPNTLLLFRRDSQAFCRRVNGGVFVTQEAAICVWNLCLEYSMLLYSQSPYQWKNVSVSFSTEAWMFASDIWLRTLAPSPHNCMTPNKLICKPHVFIFKMRIIIIASKIVRGLNELIQVKSSAQCLTQKCSVNTV